MDTRALAALAPIAVLAVGFAVYCVVDIVRSEVRYLPKWAWMAICLIQIPVGGLVYLLVGRRPR